MFDFHAHVLPKADHGSSSLEMSLQQLSLAAAAGITTLVATPHFYPQKESGEEFLQRRAAAYALLKESTDAPIQLRLGAEVHFCVGLDHLEELEEMCVDGTGVLLVELPYSRLSGEAIRTLQRLRDLPWLTPVLAHVDRYDPEQISALFSLGLLGQVNADALCHISGRRRLCRWIDEGHIVALGSDIHGTSIGYKNYCRAVTYLGDRAALLMQRTAELIQG